MNDKTVVENIDCMIGMKEFPDKYFDLAIVDPPYGINAGKIKSYARNGSLFTKYKPKDWDSKIPTEEYFNELFRISKNQIIWGGNYFKLPISKAWIVWDKMQSDGFNISMFELAWQSNQLKLSKMYKKSASWNNGGDNSNRMSVTSKRRIHPTQKPVALYKWLLKNYAKEGDKILDTHLGSQSSRIAAFDGGFDFTGYELDKDYFEAGNKRFSNHKIQLKLFA